MHPRQTWLRARRCWRPLRCRRPSSTNGSTPTGWFTTPIRPSPGAEKIVTASAAHLPASGAPATQPRPRAAPQRPAGGLNYTEFSITSPAPEQTFFGDESSAVHLDSGARRFEPEPDHHLAFERQAARISRRTPRIVCSAAPGSRHLRARGDHHRSADGRIADHATA